MTTPWIKAYLAETKTTIEDFNAINYMKWIDDKHYKFQHAQITFMPEKEYSKKFNEFIKTGRL